MAVKYKLIKDYPGSPCEVGEIVSSSWSHIKHLKVEEFPEFWERVPEKDYEILSFLTLTNAPMMVGKTSEGWFTGFLEEGINKNRDAEWLLQHGYIIHSVKRLSDGEIFTVGDEVVEGEILGFELSGSHTIRYRADGIGWKLLSDAKKVSKSIENKQIDLLCLFLNYVEDTAYYNSGGWVEREQGNDISRTQLAQDFLKTFKIATQNVSTNS